MTMDFLVVGAQKAGTTTLHDWLVCQPNVVLPSIKETHFFSHEERFGLGPEWYQQQFPHAAPLRGEVDPEYMYVPQAAARIAAHGGAAALVFLLRHPLERAFSHFQMTRRRGLEPLDFGAALEAEGQRLAAADPAAALHARDHWSYLDRGNYAPQILRLQDALPQASCLFLCFEDLVSAESSASTHARVAEFIGLSGAGGPLSERSNPASEPRIQWLNQLLWQGGGVRRAVGSLIPSKDVKRRIGIWLDRINQRPPRVTERLQDLTLPRWVRNHVAKQIDATQSRTNLDLATWQQRLDRCHWRD